MVLDERLVREVYQTTDGKEADSKEAMEKRSGSF